MKSATYPLAITEELLAEVRQTSLATGLSMADAMRQSMKLGLPRLRARLARDKGSVPAVKPFTKAEARKAFGPDRGWDKLDAAMAQCSIPRREEEE